MMKTIFKGYCCQNFPSGEKKEIAKVFTRTRKKREEEKSRFFVSPLRMTHTLFDIQMSSTI